MTGFGDARHERADHALAAEVRTINNRHFKLNLRTTEGYGALDARIEAVVREYVRRGTVNVNLRIRHMSAADDYRLNADVLENYVDQLQKVAAKRSFDEELRLEPLAQPARRHRGALDRSARRRRRLAAAGADAARGARSADRDARRPKAARWPPTSTAQCSAVEASLKNIAARSPQVAEGYRQRLQDRVGEALAKFNVVDRADRPDPRSLPVCRSQRHFRRNRPAPQPSAAIRPGPAGRRKRRPQARVYLPGNGPRNEHHRLQGERRGDLA